MIKYSLLETLGSEQIQRLFILDVPNGTFIPNRVTFPVKPTCAVHSKYGVLSYCFCFSFLFFFFIMDISYYCTNTLDLQRRRLLNDGLPVSLFISLFDKTFIGFHVPTEITNSSSTYGLFFFGTKGYWRGKLFGQLQCIREIWIFLLSYNKISRNMSTMFRLVTWCKYWLCLWLPKTHISVYATRRYSLFLISLSVDFYSEPLPVGCKYLYDIRIKIYIYIDIVQIYACILYIFLSELTKLLKCWLRVGVLYLHIFPFGSSVKYFNNLV